MAKILKAGNREFSENNGKIDGFRIFTDMSREKNGIAPKTLNFDIRRLDAGQCSAPYHFHRYAEELFMIVSGAATLRTPDGLHTVESGDVMFFESGENGAHQLYNHTSEPCVFLDARSYIGYDVCEYPDSGKILLAPSMEVFRNDSRIDYFDGEENIREKWARVQNDEKSPGIRFRKITNDYPYALLLLADETVDAIHKYLFASDVIVAQTDDGEIVGAFCLLRIDADTLEIKNIAVAESWQRRGIGGRLLQEAERIARTQPCKTLMVGTGDCGFNQIRFYERNGFRKFAVKENFFIENYAAPIYENGVQLKDMVMLKKEIVPETI